jgi:hypothetical protein
MSWDVRDEDVELEGRVRLMLDELERVELSSLGDDEVPLPESVQQRTIRSRGLIGWEQLEGRA